MSRLDVRFAVHRERLRLASMLDELAPDEWEQPSLWPGWRIRDVVGHLVAGPQSTLGSTLAEFRHARGDVSNLIQEAARRRASVPTAALVGELRTAAESDRRRPLTSHLAPLVDILVHGQDIAVPLKRNLPMPVNDAAVAASRVWRTRAVADRRWMRGLRFSAVDVAWSRGDGTLVQGPMEPVLLAIRGRAVAVPRLAGPGVELLAERLGTQPGQ